MIHSKKRSRKYHQTAPEEEEEEEEDDDNDDDDDDDDDDDCLYISIDILRGCCTVVTLAMARISFFPPCDFGLQPHV